MTSNIPEQFVLPVPAIRRWPQSAMPGLTFRLRRLSPTAILGLVLVLGVAVMALFADVLAPVSPWSSVAKPFQSPGPAHPLGTDDLGRDLLAGIIHGSRTSLIVGLTVAGLSAGIGIILGLSSGYFGGVFDDVLMRLTEFFQVIPRFFLALVAVALFEPGLVTVTLVLGLTSWPMTVRLLRAQVLSIREREYVIAARALGADHQSILWMHILPNTLTPVIVHTSLMIGQAMLTEASLAFLGLGDPNHISWGYLLNNAQPFLRTAWWMPLFPGLAIALAVLGFNLLSDGLNNSYWQRG
ncbi:MAG: ABC transporter permease [Anaerolineales bacterium]